jgi:hypothetical protein
MARIIKFYVPKNYRPKTQPVVSIVPGKVIEFSAASSKPSA